MARFEVIGTLAVYREYYEEAVEADSLEDVVKRYSDESYSPGFGTPNQEDRVFTIIDKDTGKAVMVKTTREL